MHLLTRILPFLMVAETVMAVDVTLDFNDLEYRIDAPDGASAAQFDSDAFKPTEHDLSNTHVVRYEYCMLDGFPQDNGTTNFSRFLDVCFSSESPKGMALGQIWATPCKAQTPEGAVGDHYDHDSWSRLDFRMYEPAYAMSSENNYLLRMQEEENVSEAYGFTAPFYVAAVRRAHAENKRILPWFDLHFTYPSWMWAGSSMDGIKEGLEEEAMLHLVYFAKWLVACHGIPVHAISHVNEPESGWRPHFSKLESIQYAKILREKLDEAGLNGVRVIPGARLDFTSDLNSMVDEIHENPEYEPYVDILAGHCFYGQGVEVNRIANTPTWVTSGVYSGYYDGAWSFVIGDKNTIDEGIRISTWRMTHNISLTGDWSFRRRVGLLQKTLVPADWDPYSTGAYRASIDGASVAWPWVRPGMYTVGGSLGNEPSDDYSVDGFAGRGHRPCILITNDGSNRSFAVNLKNLTEITEFEVYQADESNHKSQMDNIVVSGSRISISVPGNSVTALVGTKSNTKPAVYVIVKDRSDLSSTDSDIIDRLRGLPVDVIPLSQDLPADEQNEMRTKRHPVDPMGAACYVLTPSVDDTGAIRAHDAVMAPVVAVGQRAARCIKTDTGTRISAGENLSRRDRLDPPADMLPDGTPLATGYRASIGENELEQLAGEVVTAIMTGGACDTDLSGTVAAKSHPVTHTAAASRRIGMIVRNGRIEVTASGPTAHRMLHLRTFRTNGRLIAQGDFRFSDSRLSVPVKSLVGDAAARTVCIIECQSNGQSAHLMYHELKPRN